MINRRTTIYQQVKIPEGHVRCPSCKGSGVWRWRWGGPDSNDYKKCIDCQGLGYISDEQVMFNKQFKWNMTLFRFNWDWFYNVQKHGGKMEQ